MKTSPDNLEDTEKPEIRPNLSLNLIAEDAAGGIQGPSMIKMSE